MKQLFLLLFFLLSFSFIKAQPQHQWEYNSDDFSFSMRAYGRVFLSAGYFASHPEFRLGAFYNGQCRGIAKAQGGGCTYDTFNLNFYSNQEEGELIEFILLTPDSVEIPLSNKIYFRNNALVGSDVVPFIWMETEVYTSAEILYYRFVESWQQAVVDRNTKSVLIKIEPYLYLNNLVAYFDLAPGAVAFVNGVEQIPGITENDFTNPVVYNILGVDNNIEDWTVYVDYLPTNILDNHYENFSLVNTENNIILNSEKSGVLYLYGTDSKLLNFYNFQKGQNFFPANYRGIVFYQAKTDTEKFFGKLLFGL